MLKKKCLPVILAIMIVFGTGIVEVSAAEKESNEPSNLYVENEQATSDTKISLPSNAQIGNAEGIFASFDDSSMELDDKDNQFKSDDTFVPNSLPESSTATNQPPIADLRYIIMNPDSLINGKISTSTQIAWVWSYNGTDYTYDPDGDEIVSRNVGGISQSDIVGMLVGDIGFVTQFSVAGEYVMTFQVTDAKGAKSNLYSIAITVEDTDGNTRPVCRLSYTGTVQVLSPVTINWEDSYDADEGDSITDFRGIVYKDGVQRDIKDYFVTGSLTSNSVKLLLPQVGTYEIWASVKDNHNAWSDWAIFNVEVQYVAHNDPNFVYISEQEDYVLFRPSVGYLGKTTFNGEDAFYISSNAQIYGSIAKNFSQGVDKTIGEFGSNECKVYPVFGNGTVNKVKYVKNPSSMFPNEWSYLKFNGKSGDIFYLEFYHHSPAIGNVKELYISAHCYFIVR